MVIEAATQRQDRSTRTAALAQPADSTAEIKARRTQVEARSTVAVVVPEALWARAVAAFMVAVEVAVVVAQPPVVAEEDQNNSRLTLS